MKTCGVSRKHEANTRIETSFYHFLSQIRGFPGGCRLWGWRVGHDWSNSAAAAVAASGSVVKNTPASAGDMGLIPGSSGYPGGRHGNPLSILAWRIPRTEEPWGLQPMQLVAKESDATYRLNNKKSNKWLYLLLLLSVFSVRKLHSVHLFQLALSQFPEETEIRNC